MLFTHFFGLFYASLRISEFRLRYHFKNNIFLFYPLKHIKIYREKPKARLFSKRTRATKTRGWAPAYRNPSRRQHNFGPTWKEHEKLRGFNVYVAWPSVREISRRSHGRIIRQACAVTKKRQADGPARKLRCCDDTLYVLRACDDRRRQQRDISAVNLFEC